MSRLARIAALLALLAPAAAVGQQKVLHDIPWYSAHDAERTATLNFCHASVDRMDMVDCRNAEAASAGAMMKGTDKDPLSFLDTPAYWSANPIARASELYQCAHPNTPGGQMSLRYCNVARQSAAQDGQARR